jgi:hypothetical protein
MHVREYIDTEDNFRVAHNGVIDTEDLGMRVGTRRVGCNHYHSKHGMEMTWTAMKWYLGIDIPETDSQ